MAWLKDVMPFFIRIKMSRRFRLSNDWYSDDGYKIFNKVQVQFNPGLTVVVGCNGAGKTTLLKQINQTLENKDIPVLFHSNLTNGADKLKSKAMFRSQYDVVARIMMSSEGENIVNVLEFIANEMGQLSRDNPDAKELWYLFDAIDSGLSVDNIVEFKQVLIPLVIENNSDKDIYFVISANEYEFARNENCLDVINGKYLTFKDYEDYRNFILKSREQKNKRYDE